MHFSWGCYCDWPNKEESKQNKGQLEIKPINDSTLNVSINVTNTPLGRNKTISRDFKLYKPEYEINPWDTVNRFDRFRRKQGHWLTEDYYSIRNGIYKDNYFSGLQTYFMYYRDKKTLSTILLYENNKTKNEIEFDEYGKIKE